MLIFTSFSISLIIKFYFEKISETYSVVRVEYINNHIRSTITHRGKISVFSLTFGTLHNYPYWIILRTNKALRLESQTSPTIFTTLTPFSPNFLLLLCSYILTHSRLIFNFHTDITLFVAIRIRRCWIVLIFRSEFAVVGLFGGKLTAASHQTKVLFSTHSPQF